MKSNPTTIQQILKKVLVKYSTNIQQIFNKLLKGAYQEAGEKREGQKGRDCHDSIHKVK